MRQLRTNFSRWPQVPEPLVDLLEEIWPARCRLPGEGVEAHERYAGKVELIAILRGHVVSGTGADLGDDDDDEDILDAEAIQQAMKEHGE